MSRRVAVLAVDFQALHRLLGLPASVRIDEVRAAPDRLDVLQLRIEGEPLDPVEPGYVLPSVHAYFDESTGATVLTHRGGAPLG